jgi:hypothetical protein
MKNLFKWLGIISVALVIAFSFAACEDDIGGGGGGGSGSGITIQNWPVTGITGVITADVFNYSGTVSNQTQFETYTQSGNAASGYGTKSPVMVIDTSGFSPFKKSGTYLVWATGGKSDTRGRVFSQVKFSNGNATIDWNKPSYLPTW